MHVYGSLFTLHLPRLGNEKISVSQSIWYLPWVLEYNEIQWDKETHMIKDVISKPDFQDATLYA